MIDWVVSRALPSGILSEQLHPTKREPVGASPLTWSYATLLLAITEYFDKRDQLENVAAE